jgi:hypothetical protein
VSAAGSRSLGIDIYTSSMVVIRTTTKITVLKRAERIKRVGQTSLKKAIRTAIHAMEYDAA